MKLRKLLRIPFGMIASEHRRASEVILSENLDGLEISSYGSAHGPVWDPQRAYSLDFLQHYGKLRGLSIGVRLQSLDGLELTASTLRELSLMNPPGRALTIDLGPVAACKNLVSFGSAWRGLDYACLAELRTLESLGLTGGGQERVQIASSLPELRRLDLSFGHLDSLEELQALPELSHVDMMRVRGLRELSPLEALTKLRVLRLDALRSVRELPKLHACPRLTTVIGVTMNGLERLNGLAGSAVRELALVGCSALRPLALKEVARRLPNLERVVVSMSRKQDQQAADACFPSRVRVGSTNDFALFYEDYVRIDVTAFDPRGFV